VRQTVVDEDAARQGEHLRLVLQPSERGGKDEAIIVPLKLGTVVFARFVQFLQAEAFV
jgi:hypothetical protein